MLTHLAFHLGLEHPGDQTLVLLDHGLEPGVLVLPLVTSAIPEIQSNQNFILASFVKSFDLKRVSLTSSSHFFVSAFSMFLTRERIRLIDKEQLTLMRERKLSRSRLNSALVYTFVAITCTPRGFRANDN